MKNLLLYFSLFIFHFSFGQKHDSAKIKLHPYIVLGGSLNTPFSSGYGGNSFVNYSEERYTPSGYATGGYAYSVTAGLSIYRGWTLTCMFSNIHNGMDADGIMNEAAWQRADITISGPSETYYYNNYSLLIGITKNWEGRKSSFGIELLVGNFITAIPTLSGNGTIANNNYPNPTTYTAGAFFMSAETQRNFAGQLGAHLDINITKQVFLRILMDIELTALSLNGNYQETNGVTGNIIASGNYTIGSFTAGLFDFGGGLGYKF